MSLAHKVRNNKIDGILLSQKKYSELKLRESQTGLTIPEAFVRGIRHIGYRSNVDAISEFVDNSIQAYSLRVDLVFGYDTTISTKKPSRLAIVDDGHGMTPEMSRVAMMWGGTHRENDRTGLGRYGYGLPCAAVSIGRRFTIISKVLDGEMSAVTLDLDALDAGKYRKAAGQVAMPPARPARLPTFIRDHLNQVFPAGWRSGTIILIEKLDRLEWSTTLGMRTNLVRHFGVTYHKLANETAIFVDSERVLPIDPLFLSPACELHSLDGDRARPLDKVEIAVRNPAARGKKGRITLRYAWLPPSFGSVDKARDAVGINANARFPILKDYHGIIFSRNGRIIDVQSRLPWTVFINNDRYIRIEIEFSASLDEMFGVTTSKQQISVSTTIWDALREAGLHKAIEQLRGKVRSAKLKRWAVNPQQSKGKQEDASKHSFRYQPVRSSQAPSLLSGNGDDVAFRPNDDHPLLSGSAGTDETARALRTLVARVCDHVASPGPTSSCNCLALLERWAEELGHPLKQDPSRRAARGTFEDGLFRHRKT